MKAPPGGAVVSLQTSSTALTSAIARRAAALALREVPDPARDLVRRAFTDLIGVLIAGRKERVVCAARELVGASNTDGARIIPEGLKRAAVDCAFVNGVAAHALDYDDMALDGHPSAVLAPTLLALGEENDHALGDLVGAYVAGYETWAALRAACAVAPLHKHGWHPCSVIGSLAAAVAAGNLLKLSEAQITHAIGLAAAHASGLRANFGADAKPIQIGNACRSGLLSAKLAACGVTASTEILEHEGGFLAAFAGGAVAEPSLYFGEPDWAILREGLNFKNYPVCYGGHRLIDAARELRETPRFSLDQIEQVEVHLGADQSAILLHSRPTTVSEAKFSAEFAVAAALIDGYVGMAQMDEGYVRADNIQSLMRRMRRVPLPGHGRTPPFSKFDFIRVQSADGRVLASPKLEAARGSYASLPAADEVRAKFTSCVAGALSQDQALRLFSRLWEFTPDQTVRGIVEDCLAS